MSNQQQGNVALRMKFEQTCQDCGESDFVEDHASGDLICRSCGRVAESHVIDEGSEWRTFGDKVRDVMPMLLCIAPLLPLHSSIVPLPCCVLCPDLISCGMSLIG